MHDCKYFSLALDENTDVTLTLFQNLFLFIFIRFETFTDFFFTVCCCIYSANSRLIFNAQHKQEHGAKHGVNVA